MYIQKDKETFIMEEQEEWVPVLGYEDSYLVSNLRRVWQYHIH